MEWKSGVIIRSTLEIPLFFKRLYLVRKRAEPGALPGIPFAIFMKRKLIGGTGKFKCRSIKGRRDKE
jgi:hypothetical protein